MTVRMKKTNFEQHNILYNINDAAGHSVGPAKQNGSSRFGPIILQRVQANIISNRGLLLVGTHIAASQSYEFGMKKARDAYMQ